MSIQPQSPLIINEIQKSNPIIKHIKNIKFIYSPGSEMLGSPDYKMNETCVLYLSVSYHNQYHEYIEKRMKDLGSNYRLRILLLHVNTEINSSKVIIDCNQLCYNHNITLLLAWSDIESARYIECLKLYENTSSSYILQEKIESEYLPRITKTLTTIKSINKTDVITLLDNFDNLANICQASEQQFLLCPGLGEKKVKRLCNVLNEPFNEKKKISKYFHNQADYKKNERTDVTENNRNDSSIINQS